MTVKIITIARYTFLEAIRNRLFLLAVAGLICLFGIAEFTGELAITETREIQAVLVAAVARWFIVMTTALFVITSMLREFNDKGLEMILSLPVSKAAYYFGKYIGFMLLGLIVSVALCLLLAIYSEWIPLMVWLFSLGCEIAIIIALSMLCLFTFNNITVSFVVVFAFYLLARMMTAIQLLSISPILESPGLGQAFMNNLINAIAYLLPDLDRFTRSDWLIYGVEINTVLFVLMQTIIYLAVLFAAGLFDLYRKEI
jgi:ABC-type transport system involved in multi-copper enzyme maturation permease subunit